MTYKAAIALRECWSESLNLGASFENMRSNQDDCPFCHPERREAVRVGP